MHRKEIDIFSLNSYGFYLEKVETNINCNNIGKFNVVSFLLQTCQKLDYLLLISQPHILQLFLTFYCNKNSTKTLDILLSLCGNCCFVILSNQGGVFISGTTHVVWQKTTKQYKTYKEHTYCS